MFSRQKANVHMSISESMYIHTAEASGGLQSLPIALQSPRKHVYGKTHFSYFVQYTYA